MAESGAAADCLGPIPQAHFLLGLGIEARLEQLLGNATPAQADALRAGFRCGAGPQRGYGGLPAAAGGELPDGTRLPHTRPQTNLPPAAGAWWAAASRGQS